MRTRSCPNSGSTTSVRWCRRIARPRGWLSMRRARPAAGSRSSSLVPAARRIFRAWSRRMFAMAARRLGYRVHTLAPDHDTPTGQIADEEVNASYDDLDAIAAFARRVDVVTFEFENVSAAAVVEAERHAIVRPNGRALAITQHRVREKTFLASHGLPVTPFAAVRSDADIAAAVTKVGCPAVLKTAAFGYDGKGQLAVETPDSVAPAWTRLGRREAILEAFIDLDRG